MAGGAGGVHVQDTLVGRPAEPQADVIQVLHKGAVHQDVDIAQHLVGDLAPGRRRLQQLGLVDVAGIAPDGFVRVQYLYIVQKGHQRPLVFRLKRLAAQKRQPADVVRLQAGQDLVAHRFVKRLAVGKIPGHLVEAVLAVAAAAGHKQAGAHPAAVGDIAVFDVGVVQCSRPLSAPGRGRRAAHIWVLFPAHPPYTVGDAANVYHAV